MNIEIVLYFFTFICFVFAMTIITRYKVTIYAVIFSTLHFLIFYNFMFAISGQWIRSLNFASIIIICIYYTSRLTHHYYKKPLFASDFIVFFDKNNWNTLLELKELIPIIILYIVVIAFGIFGYSYTPKTSIELRLLSLIFLIYFIYINNYLSSRENVIKKWFKTFPDAKEINMNLSMSLKNMKYKTPNFGSSYLYFKNILEQTAEYKISDLKPNLVLWLQESTIDASLYKGNLPQTDMFKGDFKFSKLNRVHTYGGDTFKSEFEIFTGLNANDFVINSSLVFYNTTSHLKYSLPKILKEQGYFTVALNPLTPSFANTGQAYKDLGFDVYLYPYELGYSQQMKNLWRIPTSDLSECLKKIYTKFQDKQPIFIYMTTINEHAPYNKATISDFDLDKFYSKSNALTLTDYYQRQIKLSNAAIDFDKFMENTNHPYVFAYFGDHQASLGLSNDDLKLEFENKLFVTGFYVKGSPDIEPIKSYFNELGELSLMPSVLLELMQIRPNEFFKAHYVMRKICGNVDDCKDKELVKSYKSYLYDYLKDASENLENK